MWGNRQRDDSHGHTKVHGNKSRYQYDSLGELGEICVERFNRPGSVPTAPGGAKETKQQQW